MIRYGSPDEFAIDLIALWLTAGDPAIGRRMRRLAQLGVARRVPRGIQRFRTIEEAKGWKTSLPDHPEQ